MERAYYSRRAGKLAQLDSISLSDFKKFFLSFFKDFESAGYFQEYLGYECVDHGFLPGLVGSDLHTELLITIRKSHLWPIPDTIPNWTEDDLFDVIEFLYDRVSKPTTKHYHEYNNCGWHCTEFYRPSGREEYLTKINRALGAYGNGFELSSQGEVLALGDTGLEPLFEAPLPEADPENVIDRVQAATLKFRRHRSSVEDRLDAIRDLAGVLEYLRPKLKTVLDSKDEGDLFNIANGFGIRHSNDGQKNKYDRDIWYSWIFYYYLATIHAATRMIARKTPDLPLV